MVMIDEEGQETLRQIAALAVVMFDESHNEINPEWDGTSFRHLPDHVRLVWWNAAYVAWLLGARLEYGPDDDVSMDDVIRSAGKDPRQVTQRKEV